VSRSLRHGSDEARSTGRSRAPIPSPSWGGRTRAGRPSRGGARAQSSMRTERRRPDALRTRDVQLRPLAPPLGLSAESPSPPGRLRHSHISDLRLSKMSDSLSRLDGGWDVGSAAGSVWRPPPGKRGAFLHARLVEAGGRGVRVRRLGGNRAGEIRLTRFVRNAAVTVEEMAAAAGARTAGRCAGRSRLRVISASG